MPKWKYDVVPAVAGMLVDYLTDTSTDRFVIDSRIGAGVEVRLVSLNEGAPAVAKTYARIFDELAVSRVHYRDPKPSTERLCSSEW